MEKKLTKKKQAEMAAQSKKRRRILAVSISAALLLAAVALALILTLGGGKTVMRIGDIEVKEDLYAYWLSYCKYQYLTKTLGTDTRSFWMSNSGDGRSHEEACLAYAERYMRETVTAASLFEELGGELTESERKALADQYKEMANRYEIKSKKDFNRLAKPLGFSYSTLRRALLYEKEAELLRSLLALTDRDVESYYTEQYRHALIIEVRLVDRYIMDEEGDLEQDMTTGDYLMHRLTAEERAEAEAKAARIRAELQQNGSLNRFIELQGEEGLNEDVNRLQGRYEEGYFFAPASEFSSHFAKSLPDGADDVVGGILSQEKGSWREYSTVNSVFFVYVTRGTADGDRPYEREENDDFFHDIREDAVNWLYAKEVSRRAESVKVFRKIANTFDLYQMGMNELLYLS